jgi:purine-binding chemotaxis protein CheW
MARELRLITFRAGAEIFAADIMAVRQIVSYEGSKAVPTAPSFVEGIVVLRNEVVPIIDLRRRLFPGDTTTAEQPLVMIIGTNAGPVGLKVDEMRRIANVTTDDLIAAPPLIRGVRGDYLVAVVEKEGEVLLVLDLEAILTDDEQRALQSSDFSTAGTSDR